MKSSPSLSWAWTSSAHACLRFKPIISIWKQFQPFWMIFRRVKIDLFIAYLHAKFYLDWFRLEVFVFEFIGTIVNPFSTILNPLIVILTSYLESNGGLGYYHTWMKSYVRSQWFFMKTCFTAKKLTAVNIGLQSLGNKFYEVWYIKYQWNIGGENYLHTNKTSKIIYPCVCNF